MTNLWMVIIWTGICTIGTNQATFENTITTEVSESRNDIEVKEICTKSQFGTFTFSVKSCKNVVVRFFPLFVIKIGFHDNYNTYSGICHTVLSACSNGITARSPNILDCNQFRDFIISWNSTYTSLWKVVSTETILVLKSPVNNTYVKYVGLGSYSGNKDKWRFNTTWNINPDFTCVDLTLPVATIGGSSDTVKDQPLTTVATSGGNSGTVDNQLPTTVATGGESSSTIQAHSLTRVATSGSSGTVQDQSTTTVATISESLGTIQNQSPTTVANSGGSSGTVQAHSPTLVATNGGSPGTIQAYSPTRVATSGGSSGTVQDQSPKIVSTISESLGTVQNLSPTTEATSGGSSGSVQDQSTTPVPTGDESSGTIHDQLLTITISTSGRFDISSIFPSYTGTQSSGKDTTSFYTTDLTVETTGSKHPETSSLAPDQSSQATSFPYLDFLKCRCPCAVISEHNPFMYLFGKNLSTEELIERMRWRLDEIKSSLLINKTDTARCKSKKISINDNRASSTAIGWIGGVVLASVVLILVAIDLLRVRQFFTKVKTDAHVRKKKRRKKENTCPKGYVTSRL